MKRFLVSALCASLLSASAGAVRPDGPVPPRPEATIFVATESFGGDGALVSMQREAPWDAVTVASLDSPDAVVQTFSGSMYVVEPEMDRVRARIGDYGQG